MRSLRGRLRSRLLGALAVVFCIAASGSYFGARGLLYQQFDKALAAKAQSLATLLKHRGEGRVELDFADEFMPEFERDKDPEYFQIWRADGRVLERSRSAQERELERPEADWLNMACRNLTLPDGRSGRAVALHLLAQTDSDDRSSQGKDSSAGPGKFLDPQQVRRVSTDGGDAADERAPDARVVSLVVARGTEDVSQPLATFLLGLLLVGGVMLGGAAAAVELAVRWGLRPVLDLNQKVATIDASKLGTRVSTEPAVRELHPIEQTLNDVLERLEAAFERQRRFTSSAAHELRGPIAEICTLCEVALRPPREARATELALEETLAAARQMDHIVTVLLAMARTDGDQPPVLVEEPVVLAAVAHDVWRPLAGKAAGKGIECSFAIPDGVTIRTDRALLRLVLTNLVENAVEYTSPGGRIRLGWAASDASVSLTVANTTALRDPSLLARMFEPFWRLEPTAGTTVHSGLGLSLARSLASSLGGTIDAQLSEDGEMVMTLRLPAGKAPEGAFLG